MNPFSSKYFWPMRYFPKLSVRNSGTFPMVAPDCNKAYLHETVALHLHDYVGELWIGKNKIVLQPGDITISPGKVVSRYELQTGGSHLCVHFLSPEKRFRGSLLPLRLHFRLGSQTAAARDRFWRIIDHARQSGKEADSLAGCAASSLLQELILWLHLQNQEGQRPRRSSLVDESIFKLNQAIESSLTKPMLVGDLAEGVGLSADYVARLFAKRYGMKLQRYLLLRRVELARHLLITSDLRVSEIGRRAGIPDPQYFNKQFRRVVGVSPLAYRYQQELKRAHTAEKVKQPSKAAPDFKKNKR